MKKNEELKKQERELSSAIARRMSLLMVTKHTSQSELAKATGYTLNAVNFWFCGKASMPMLFVYRVAKFLGISIDVLVGWDDEALIRMSIGTVFQDEVGGTR